MNSELDFELPEWPIERAAFFALVELQRAIYFQGGKNSLPKMGTLPQGVYLAAAALEKALL